MKFSEIYSNETIGILATIIGIISYLPVLWVVHKTNKTNNFPFKTLFLALISNILWVMYGMYEPAPASILSGALYFLIYVYILYVKILN